MASNVIEFTGETCGKIPPNKIIKWADDLKEAVVIGWDKNDELYVAGSSGNIPDVVYLLLQAQAHMLNLGGDDE